MASTPAPGDIASDFTLPDSTGTLGRLAELVAARPVANMVRCGLRTPVG